MDDMGREVLYTYNETYRLSTPMLVIVPSRICLSDIATADGVSLNMDSFGTSEFPIGARQLRRRDESDLISSEWIETVLKRQI
jgi:hypothetical protein